MTEEEIYEHFIVDEDLQLLEEIEQEKRAKDQAGRDYEVALQVRNFDIILKFWTIVHGSPALSHATRAA